jgi:hypothetical protein
MPASAMSALKSATLSLTLAALAVALPLQAMAALGGVGHRSAKRLFQGRWR